MNINIGSKPRVRVMFKSSGKMPAEKLIGRFHVDFQMFPLQDTLSVGPFNEHPLRKSSAPEGNSSLKPEWRTR